MTRVYSLPAVLALAALTLVQAAGAVPRTERTALLFDNVPETPDDLADGWFDSARISLPMPPRPGAVATAAMGRWASPPPVRPVGVAAW